MKDSLLPEAASTADAVQEPPSVLHPADAAHPAVSACEWKRVTLDFSTGPRDFDALCYGSWCVDDRFGMDDCWVLSHQPTGFCVRYSAGGTFPSAPAACAAMIRVQALRDDWAAVDLAKVRKDGTRATIAAICREHGGELADGAGHCTASTTDAGQASGTNEINTLPTQPSSGGEA